MVSPPEMGKVLAVPLPMAVQYYYHNAYVLFCLPGFDCRIMGMTDPFATSSDRSYSRLLGIPS